MTAREDDRQYRVVVNDEEQYSIWPGELEVPAGWHEALEPRSKEDCLRYVDEVWTDMRPQSLRRWMAEQEQVESVVQS